MQPLEYLHLQMQLEGREIRRGCFLGQVEIVPGEEMPLVLIARLANEEPVAYYAEDLPPDLQKRLSAAVMDFPECIPLLHVLRDHEIECELEHYKTYIFPVQPASEPGVLCLSKQDSRVKDLGFDGFAEEVHAAACDDRLVAACVSTRENQACGEAWVYTLPQYRRRGVAQKVVRAWARSLMQAGKVPFYSHNIQNEASAGLAYKLGLRPVFEEVCIKPKQKLGV